MKDLLKSWGLLQVTIQNNLFIACQLPTTQEDNFGQVVERMELYHKPYHLTNGELSEMKEGKTTKVGRLVKYTDGNYSVFHGQVRYNLNPSDVIIYR